MVFLFLFVAGRFALQTSRRNDWDGILCSRYEVGSVVTFLIILGLLDDGAIDRLIGRVCLAWGSIALVFIVCLWVGVALH